MQIHWPIRTVWLNGTTSNSTSGGGSIAAKLSESNNANVEKNRSYLFKVVDIVRLLSALGLPFRGHREAIDSESRGNYLEVCKFFSKYDPDFQSMQSNYFNATSPDFQNEIIEICANLVCAEIAEKVQDTGFFAVIADEARSSHTEQLSVCLRYTEQLEIKERFLCFIDSKCSWDRGRYKHWIGDLRTEKHPNCCPELRWCRRPSVWSAAAH